MNVILIGFMATGKSTVGRALGRRIDAPFIDTDRELRRQFGLGIPEIFVQHGESAFREAETALLQALADELTQRMDRPRRFPRKYVLSTGGGTSLRPENQALLTALGHVVWLRARVETIAARCRPHIDKRPLLREHSANIEERIAGLLAEREPLYAMLAKTTIWTDDETTPEEIARKIRIDMAAGGARI